MKRAGILLLLVAGLCPSAFSQSPVTSATPPDVDDDVVKISTTLIQMDAVVVDKKGRQVTNLTADDFEIYERGKKQKITYFTYVSNVSLNEKPNAGESKPDSIGIPTTRLSAREVRRTYAIVVDDLGIAFANIGKIKDALRKFVNEQVQQGDLVSIIRTGRGTGALQGFTSDKRQLLAAIDKIRFNFSSRGGINSFEPIRTSLKEDLANMQDSQGNVTTPEGIEEDNEFQKSTDETRKRLFEGGTIGALGYVVDGMSKLPGRKSVVLFTEGFSAVEGGKNEFLDSEIIIRLRRLAEYANRASIVFYTIDARGLQNPYGATAEDYIPDIFASTKIEDRGASFTTSQSTMRFLAYETGGVPFMNNNSMTKGLDRAMEDQKGYYLIAYEPDDETFAGKKPKYNEIKISVIPKGLEVHARKGFFSIPDSAVTEPKLDAGRQIYRALTSPFDASDISLSLNALYSRDENNVQYIQSLVYIDGRDLTFTTQPDGNRKANFDLVAVTLGETNRPVDEAMKNYSITVSENNYRKLLEKGFVYNLNVPIKKPGGYQFRIVVRDSASTNVGSASQFVVVPDSSKKRLDLSSIIISRFTSDEWKMILTGSGNKVTAASDGNVDNALRVFRKGDVLRFDYVMYDAKTSSEIEIRTRLIKDGKVLVEGDPELVASKSGTSRSQENSGSIALGGNLVAGDYILQIIVTDNGAKKKYSTATQWVEFELID